MLCAMQFGKLLPRKSEVCGGIRILYHGGFFLIHYVMLAFRSADKGACLIPTHARSSISVISIVLVIA